MKKPCMVVWNPPRKVVWNSDKMSKEDMEGLKALTKSLPLATGTFATMPRTVTVTGTTKLLGATKRGAYYTLFVPKIMQDTLFVPAKGRKKNKRKAVRCAGMDICYGDSHSGRPAVYIPCRRHTRHASGRCWQHRTTLAAFKKEGGA